MSQPIQFISSIPPRPPSLQCPLYKSLPDHSILPTPPLGPPPLLNITSSSKAHLTLPVALHHPALRPTSQSTALTPCPPSPSPLSSIALQSSRKLHQLQYSHFTLIHISTERKREIYIQLTIKTFQKKLLILSRFSARLLHILPSPSQPQQNVSADPQSSVFLVKST